MGGGAHLKKKGREGGRGLQRNGTSGNHRDGCQQERWEVHTKRKEMGRFRGFGLLGCRAVGPEVGLQGGSWAAHLWAGVDVSGSKAE